MPIKYTLESFNLTPKSTAVLGALFIFTILFSNKILAACPREDVKYYLEQGFNHEQIVQMCSSQNTLPQHRSTPPNRPPQEKNYSSQDNQQLSPKKLEQNITPLPNVQTQPAEPPYQQRTIPSQTKSSQQLDRTPRYYNENYGTYVNSDAVFLATALEAYDVELSEQVIMFTRKDCFDYGPTDWNGFQNRTCPNVKYTIARGGLKIVERDNGFFGMGSTALYISGDIKAEILDFDQLNPKHQKAIDKIIHGNTKKLKIDVRSGIPQSKVEAVLLKLAG